LLDIVEAKKRQKYSCAILSLVHLVV